MKDGPVDDINSSVELSGDAFEILDPADVSNSGSFGETQQIKILETDIILDAAVPAVEEEPEDSTLVTKEKIDFQLVAGKRCLLPVVAGSNKFELLWEFTSSPKVEIKMFPYKFFMFCY